MKKDNWFEEKFLQGKKAYLWIVGAGLLTYFWTLFFGFSYFDDMTLILDNQFYLRNLGNFFNTFAIEVFHVLHASAAYYRPILTISFMLDAQISGANPFFYHVTNILIHLACSCLLFILLKKLNIKTQLSFLFSVIFAVHPVLTQAVAWIPGRNDSLLALFVFASMIRIIEAFEFSTSLPADATHQVLQAGEVKKTVNVFWHLVFFFLAIFTKESGILIPVLVVLWFLFYRLKDNYPAGEKLKVLTIFHPKGGIAKTPRYMTLIFGWVTIIVFWFLLRKIALVNPIQYNLTEIVKSLVLALPAVLLFIGKIFLPFNLSVLPTLQDSTLIYGVVSFLTLIIFLLFSKGKKLSVICFGLAWFLMFLIPSFIRPDNSYVPDFLEHRVYLPIVGIFLILSEADFIKNLDLSKRKVFWGVSCFITVITIINFIHTSNFRNRLVFWKSAVATSPNHPLAHKNIGAMLYWDNNFDGAEKEYLESLKLNPQETMVHNNLGLIYFNQGKLQQAEEEYQKELLINPAYDNAFFNYGLLRFKQGKTDEAEKFWLKTLEVNPDYTDAMKNLFVVYSQKKDQVKAAYYYNELLKRGITLNLSL